MSSTPASPLARLRPRDRAAVLAGLAGVTLLSWLYLIDMARDMQRMPMAGMEAMALRPWTGTHFALMFAMWAIMMVGMMLPSATPATLVYAAVRRKAEQDQSPVAPTALFVLGYLIVWTLFSLAATVAQWLLEAAALLSAMMVSTSPALGGGLLVAAGAYQLTPLKEACLEHCRSPVHFLSDRWRPGTLGALRMGIDYGAYCLGCCWVLMTLLFVGGVMNLLWIAAITLYVLVEKVWPFRFGGERVSGVALVATGVWVLARHVGAIG